MGTQADPAPPLISQIDPKLKREWEKILTKEGLSIHRGRYPRKLKFGWRYRDTDLRNKAVRGSGIPGTDKSFTRPEDDYSEESRP